MAQLIPLLIEEQQANDAGFTHFVSLGPNDLTETTADTPQDISLGTVPAGWIINKSMVVLVTPFKDASDAAFNTTAMVVGDAGSANRYVTSTQLNENGTEITLPKYNATSYQVTADTEILANIAAMAAKSLSDIDTGEVHIFLQLIDTLILSDLQSPAVIA